MLLVILPLPIVLAAVWPCEDAAPVLLVLHVVTNVLPPILPYVSAGTVHPAVLPLPSEDAAISPLVRPVSLYRVVLELALVRGAIRPREPPSPPPPSSPPLSPPPIS